MTLWIGGHRIKIKDVIKAVARATGITDREVAHIDWDTQIHHYISQRNVKKQPQPHKLTKNLSEESKKSVSSRDFIGVRGLTFTISTILRAGPGF